ncbi:MAG: DUF1559 domain-containing protein, partial [Pirellulales bacterium]|nr:DUF1559 domain-containing protein [Pirellulales bacterium]
PVPWFDPKSYIPWGQRPGSYVCPTDQDQEKFPTAASYVINYGDGVVAVGAPVERELLPYAMDRTSKRGIAVRERFVRFRDVLDGLANSVLLSEAKLGGLAVAKNINGLSIDPSLCLVVRDQPATEYWAEGRQARWSDGSLRSVGFQTILPPNAPSATSNLGELEGVMSASSYHVNGVHVLFADGSVRFATDSIDTGDISAASVAADRQGGHALPGSRSPYGLWGAYGTISSREIIPAKSENVIDPPRELDPDEIAELQKRPLRSWTMADGGGTIRARQVDLVQEAFVILLTEDNKTRNVPLSALKSEDAYFAVQSQLEESIRARKTLKDQLSEGVRMLEQRQFDQFVERFVVDERDRKLIAQGLGAQRGLIIYGLDQAILSLESPAAERLFRSDDKGEHFEIRPPGGMRMRFLRKGDRWMIEK